MRTTCLSVILLCGCSFDPTEAAGGTDDSSESTGSTASASTAVTTASTASVSSSGPSSSGASEGDDSSSSSSGSTTGGSAESSESSSSTGEPHADYAPCTEDDDSACAGDEVCLWTDGVQEGIEATGFCAAPCNEPGDCPAAPDGSDAELTCTYDCAMVLRCMLRCPAGQTCPDDTQCLGTMHLPECSGTYVDICV